MARNQARTSIQSLWSLAFLNLTMCALAAYLWRLRSRIARQLGELSNTLDEAGIELMESADQVSSGSKASADGTSRQASALEQTSASLEEIAATARQNANHAQSAKNLSAETKLAAETGHRDMKELIAAMDEIKAASAGIASIIKTIDEIAFQTNILALNAAVEAARAGESGMGFAVVADEVRNLAQRSASAARETAERVESVIEKSNHGVQVSGKVARVFETIVSRAGSVDQLVAEIATASQQQNTGLEQMNRAVADIEKVTQSNASTAEESAAAAEILTAQARSLGGVVDQLKALAGVGSAAAGDEASTATIGTEELSWPSRGDLSHAA
jgi:methyl-accepting chemotaxis protein